MDIIYNLFFYVIAFVLVIAALGVVFLPRIVYSAVAMILAFISVAGIFVLLNADFVAISQIIIYAVGITIVMIFAIMLTGRISEKKLWIAFAPRTLFAFATSGAFFVTILFAITDGFKSLARESNIFSATLPSIETIDTLQNEGTTGIIGKALFTKYVLPFEILSLLLLAAIIGAVVLAKKDRDNLVNPTTNLIEED
ncbi:MAG: NADH-quinone oxidoreductase subunit J [bacterium]